MSAQPQKRNTHKVIKRFQPRLIELETDYLVAEEIRVNNQADWYRERIWGELETRETAQNRGM
jgi:hypothetical protein